MSERADDKSTSAARYVPADVSDARLARLWGGIAPRLPGPQIGGFAWQRAAFGVLLLGAVAAGAFGVFAHRERNSGASPLDGASLETHADTLSIQLVDGSSMRLAASTQARVEHDASTAVKVVLQKGRIECDVVHHDGRSFVVLADGIEVRVVGTHFSVSLDPSPAAHRVDVSVERGVVEVRGESGGVSRVEAGHSFSQTTSLASANAAPNVVVEAPPSASPSALAAPVPDSSAAPQLGASSVAAADHPKEHAEGAKELLEHAGDLRRDGRAREAAAAYDLLLTRFPSDPRAGLAAFELGRLRMDRLGDLPGAIRALELAARAAPGAGFREDAIGRLANAYAARGDMTSCARVRDRYLREYPNGIHRSALEHRCGSE
ncbi:MAG TPA: FecR domain-containing protein [Polyangiaceae bacterium]